MVAVLVKPIHWCCGCTTINAAYPECVCNDKAEMDFLSLCETAIEAIVNFCVHSSLLAGATLETRAEFICSHLSFAISFAIFGSALVTIRVSVGPLL